MRSIHSLTYTNVALTVLILLLSAVLVKPYLTMPAAQAQSSLSENFRKADPMEEKRSSQQEAKVAQLNPNADNAAALREIAAAAREIADAIREGAKSQGEVAKALGKLSEPTP